MPLRHTDSEFQRALGRGVIDRRRNCGRGSARHCLVPQPRRQRRDRRLPLGDHADGAARPHPIHLQVRLAGLDAPGSGAGRVLPDLDRRRTWGRRTRRTDRARGADLLPEPWHALGSSAGGVAPPTNGALGERRMAHSRSAEASTIPRSGHSSHVRRGVRQLGACATLSACDCITAGTTTKTVPNLT